MLRLATDADVHGDIVRGLRRRLPEIDLIRVQDALPEGTPDREVLAWTAAEDRILVSMGCGSADSRGTARGGCAVGVGNCVAAVVVCL